MKIAVIGSNGLLGSSLKNHLSELKIESLFLTHDKFDITDVSCYDILKDKNIDVVINTAAYLGVEPCEQNPGLAFNINTLAVNNLARYCNQNKIVLAQISTDGVFDGQSGSYDEHSVPKPINFYGITKYNAELLVQSLCREHYIFRIPILFGLRENIGNTFVEKMYNTYLNGKTNLRIADDVRSKPSYSFDVAKKIIDIIINKEEFGIYHVFNEGSGSSLYEFASEFFKAKGVDDINISKVKASEFAANEIGLKPLDTTIISIKTKPLRSWKEAMIEYCELGK